MENSMALPQKLKLEPHYDPAIPLLDSYSEKSKILVRNNICTTMFAAALYIIAKKWKQPEVSSTDD